jgi:hypothetical protein
VLQILDRMTSVCIAVPEGRWGGAMQWATVLLLSKSVAADVKA